MPPGEIGLPGGMIKKISEGYIKSTNFVQE
jgi:hypothetical protein